MERVKRSYFICHGTTSIPASVMQAATGSDLVYFKEYEHGVLYSLYFKHENRKQHSTVENSIQRLDSMLMTKNMTTRTHFTSLTEIGKVKSFSGRDRHDDYHFCEIFDVSAPKRDNGKQYQIQNGVVIWNQSMKDAEEGGYGGLVQKLVFDDDDCVDEDVVCNDVGEGSKSEIEDVKQVLASTEASLATEKETVATLQKENEELKKKIVGLESRESQVEAGVVEALQKENEELKKQNASLCTSESVMVSQKREVKRLEHRLGEAQIVSANWEKQANTLQGVVREKEKTVEELRRKLAAHDSPSGRSEREKQFETRIAELRCDVEAGQEEARTLRQQVNAAGEKLKEREKQWERTQDRLTSSAAVAEANLNRQIKALEEQCFQQKARNAELAERNSPEMAQALRVSQQCVLTLERQVRELQEARGERMGLAPYTVLLRMAECMNQMGKDMRETPEFPRLTFQDHVYSLVSTCNSGIGLDAKEAAERQQRIYALLNPVYANAAKRAEAEHVAQRVNPVMVKTAKNKRARGGE